MGIEFGVLRPEVFWEAYEPWCFMNSLVLRGVNKAYPSKA